MQICHTASSKCHFFGLPKTLEQTINNILEESKLASYKIAGMGRGLQLSYNSMQTWRTRVCRLYINQHPKVGIVGSPQDRIEETEKGYRNR